MSRSPAVWPDQFATFGDLLKHLRRRAGLTQQELAIAVGYSDGQISRLEQNLRIPDRAALTARFVPALNLEHEPDWVERLLSLATGRRIEPAPPLAAHGSALVQSHLPVQLTPFIGREAELAEIARLLGAPDCRLLTLVGPGGIGKTRLALEAAADALPTFSDGVCFVPLAPLDSPDLIAATVAGALGLSLHRVAAPKAHLLRHLRDKTTLLVMDNFEHLLDGVGLLVEILGHAPRVKVLATSRERLNLASEWLIELQGLRFPDQGVTGEAADYSAVQMFVQAARRVRPDFALAEADNVCVAHICRLVEGMPLAVELAAAWVPVLDCGQIAREIEQGLDFLAVALRDMPERHRSMRAVFDGSWQMLSEAERRAFRRLSVFRGGFTREAAEQVAGADLPWLSALVNKSLVRRDAAGRFEMHELLTQYAGDRLAEAGEADGTRAQHLEFYIQLAEQAEPELRGRDQVLWLDRLEAERDNLWAALEWSFENDAQAGLRLAGALFEFWLHNRLSEGRVWLSNALGHPSALGHTATRAKALRSLAGLRITNNTGWVASVAPLQESVAIFRQLGPSARRDLADSLAALCYVTAYLGDNEAKRALFEESEAIFRQLGPDGRSGLGNLLIAWGGDAALRGDYQAARPPLNEARAIFEGLGDRLGLSVALRWLGYVDFGLGDLAAARSRLEAALATGRELGNKQITAWALLHLADLALVENDYSSAGSLYGEALSQVRNFGDLVDIGWSLHGLARVALGQDDYNGAATLFDESLAMFRAVDDSLGITWCLEGFACVAGKQGDPARAARLFGASEGLREALRYPLRLDERVANERHVAAVRAELGEGAFAAAWAEGRAMTLEEAVDYALSSKV